MVSLTTNANIPLYATLFKMAGNGFALFGFNNETEGTTVYIIPKPKLTMEELASRMKPVPGVLKISVAELEDPLTKENFAGIRKLFEGIGKDLKRVSAF